MPYVAQRKFVMFGQTFGPPGNMFDLPHIIPSDMIERMPHRSLLNMVNRRMVVQVEATSIADGIARSVATVEPAGVPADMDADPRVQNEGHGWWTVEGKRVHGRNGVKRALAELGG